MAPFDARNEIDRLRYEMIDKLSAQDVRIERSLNEATECVVEAKDAARLSSEASKQSVEAQTKAKEAADRSIELLIRFEKAMAEQTERMRQGAEEFRQMREWMKEKSKECAGHQQQTTRLEERFESARNWTPTAVASVVSAAVAAGAAWMLRG